MPGNTTARGVIFPDDFLVLDEAHTVPEVATNNFGLALSSYSVDRALKYLYNPRTKRGLLRKHGGPAAQQLSFEQHIRAEKHGGHYRRDRRSATAAATAASP